MITILSQPINVNYYPGNQYRFAVTAVQSEEGNYLTYSWEYADRGGSNWAAVPNTTASTYTLFLNPSDVGYGEYDYRVTITEFNSEDVQQDQVISETVTAILFNGRTNVKPTKARYGSKIRNRVADTHEFVQRPEYDSMSISGNIGYPSLVDAMNNVEYPNIQSAILDAAYMGQLNVGSIIIETANVDPSGLPQVDILTFTGTVTSPFPGNPVNFDVFGYRVQIQDGAPAATVRDAVLGILNDMADRGLFVKDVTSVSTESITFKYKDTKPHAPISWTQYGITMTGEVGSPAKPGYGYWQKVLVEEKTDMNNNPMTYNHWKRIA